MVVQQSNDGFGAGELEEIFTFVVNGQTQQVYFKDPALQVGTHQLNVSFLVNVPTPSSSISVQVSAQEEDGSFHDTFTHQFDQAQNWGEGGHQGALIEPDTLSCTVYYSVSCAQPKVAVLSEKALIGYAQARAATRKKISPSPQQLLSWSLTKLSRRGWDLIQVTGDTFVFKGYGYIELE